MKKITLAFLLSVLAITAQAQNETDTIVSKLKLGVNVGINQSILLAPEGLPEQASVENRMGMSMGLFLEYNLGKFITVSPKAELFLNKANVEYLNNDGFESTYYLSPVLMDLKLHIIAGKQNGKLKPYFLVGPNVRIPLFNKSENPSEFGSNGDLALDLGVGLDRVFKKTTIAPELRYTYGFYNVNGNPRYRSLNLHTVSLIFNFKS